jgi:hypothetical protein
VAAGEASVSGDRTAGELIRPWAFVIAYVAVGRMALQWSQLVRVEELPTGVLGWRSPEAANSREWDFFQGISGTVAKGRGWLLRRTLAMADIAALVLAFLTPQWALGAREAQVELLLFLLTIPVWILAANAYGLYKGDEEHADHSTLDEVPRVLHLVTLGAWLVFLGTWALGIAQPDLAKEYVNQALGVEFQTAMSQAPYFFAPANRNVELSEEAAALIPAPEEYDDLVTVEDLAAVLAEREAVTDRFTREFGQ